jgi:hypothetical protein
MLAVVLEPLLQEILISDRNRLSECLRTAWWYLANDLCRVTVDRPVPESEVLAGMMQVRWNVKGARRDLPPTQDPRVKELSCSMGVLPGTSGLPVGWMQISVLVVFPVSEVEVVSI